MLKPILLGLAVLVAPNASSPSRPTPVIDTVAPVLPNGLKRAVLIVSKTNAYRHYQQIPHSNAVVADLAAALGRKTFTTENAAVFNDAALARFSVVVLNNVSGDFLSEPQKVAFRRYVERGGGVVALHSAGDSSHAWDWYLDTLLATKFTGHPLNAEQFQSATVKVERPDHPVMRGVTLPWAPVDEWYSFVRSPRGPGVTVLATIDEGSYRPGTTLAMGADHPVIWTSEKARGRIVFSALGHKAEAYDDPNYRRIIANAIRWTARQ